eukprot:7716173-Lingulodinium_polyedra.AAC.1
MGSPAVVSIFSHCYKYAVAAWQDGQRREGPGCRQLWCREPVLGKVVDASLTVYADDLGKLFLADARHVGSKARLLA